MKFYILLATILFSTSAISAQEKPVTAEAVFLGAEQPTVDKLPLPEYPKDARKAGLGGRVSVKVTVDNTGKVTSVEDADGPYPVCKSVTTPKVLALRLAATNAARRTIFKPAVVNQNPAGASGRIAYIFTPPTGNKSKEMRLDRITKLGSSDPDVVSDGKAPASDSDSRKTIMSITLDPNYKPSAVDPAVTPAKTDISGSKTISGGVLSGKALALPKPHYPPAAKAVHAGGAVNVQVLILEDGSVYSAQAVSGHPLLRHEAEVTGCGARFTPTLLQGDPVKVSGIITYNFVP